MTAADVIQTVPIVILLSLYVGFVHGQSCDLGEQPADPCLVMVGSTCAGPPCEPCPVGTYSPEVNEAPCIVCPDDSSTEYAGATSLDQCECNRGFTRASPCASPSECKIPDLEPAEVTVHATIRDFLSYASGLGGHPDFGTVTGPYNGNWASPATGMVRPLSGSDGLPVYNGDDVPGGTFVSGSGKRLTSGAAFDQWYRDSHGINYRLEDCCDITLTADTSVSPTEYTYESGNGDMGMDFFPADGLGLNDLGYNDHNFYFTAHWHFIIKYIPGTEFTVRGDDDIWIFIDGHLVVDLGGVHTAAQGQVTLDDLAEPLGLGGVSQLIEGEMYEMDIFLAERYETASNFRLVTNYPMGLLKCLTDVDTCEKTQFMCVPPTETVAGHWDTAPTGLDGYNTHAVRPPVDGPSSNHIHMTNRDHDHHYEGPYNHAHPISGDGVGFGSAGNGHDGRRHAGHQHDGRWHSPQDEIADLSLHHAAAFGDADNVRLLLTGMQKNGQPDPMGARDPNARGPGGKTPLHRAVDNDRYDTTEMLLLHNASVDAVDKYYWTPLHKAAEKGWYWITKLLLAYGANVNAIDKYGWTPLHRAAQNGHLRVATYLVDMNATVDHGRAFLGHFYRDVNAFANQDGTPMHCAAYANHADIIDMLVSRNATIDAMDKYGWMPLHKAANGGRAEAARTLIRHGADKNAKGVYGGTPLDEAIANGHVELAKELAALGATRTTPAGEGIRSSLPHPMSSRSYDAYMAREFEWEHGTGWRSGLANHFSRPYDWVNAKTTEYQWSNAGADTSGWGSDSGRQMYWEIGMSRSTLASSVGQYGLPNRNYVPQGSPTEIETYGMTRAPGYQYNNGNYRDEQHAAPEIFVGR